MGRRRYRREKTPEPVVSGARGDRGSLFPITPPTMSHPIPVTTNLVDLFDQIVTDDRPVDLQNPPKTALVDGFTGVFQRPIQNGMLKLSRCFGNQRESMLADD